MNTELALSHIKLELAESEEHAAYLRERLSALDGERMKMADSIALEERRAASFRAAIAIIEQSGK